MKIEKETIDQIAHLARLEILPDERDGLMQDMNRILQFMDKLNEVDTEGIEPLIYMTEESTVLRKDVVQQVTSTSEALQNAPAHDGKYFRVAKVIDKS